MRPPLKPREVKVRDEKKCPLRGLIWRKNKSWHIETIKTKPVHKYRIYGGIAASGQIVNKYQSWVLCGRNDAHKTENFKDLKDAMKWCEENLDRRFYI